jgi:hypothetical protein
MYHKEAQALVMVEMPRRPLLHALCLALTRLLISFLKKGTSKADIAGNLTMQNLNRKLLNPSIP